MEPALARRTAGRAVGARHDLARKTRLTSKVLEPRINTASSEGCLEFGHLFNGASGLVLEASGRKTVVARSLQSRVVG